jgi:CubicO group peptidase (beta-lactamase class C family)
MSKHLSGVPADKAGITLHHLLTHSSGLESDFSPTDYEPVGREEYVGRALKSKLLFEPGRGYEYSNSGYSLLAAIVEKVSDKPYEAYLIEHVLEPAGMLESGYKAPGWATSRIAHGYRDGQDWGTILQRIQAPDAPYWMLRGNGGLHTTLGDMLLWHRALDSDAALSKEVGMMRNREGRLGRFVKSSALATVPREGDTVQTIVQLEFEKGSVFNIYVWGPRRLLGIRGTPQLPALRFLPVSDRSFAAYSGGPGRTVSWQI